MTLLVQLQRLQLTECPTTTTNHNHYYNNNNYYYNCNKQTSESSNIWRENEYFGEEQVDGAVGVCPDDNGDRQQFTETWYDQRTMNNAVKQQQQQQQHSLHSASNWNPSLFQVGYFPDNI